MEAFRLMEYSLPLGDQPREEWRDIVDAYALHSGEMSRKKIRKVLHAMKKQYDFVVSHASMELMSQDLLTVIKSLLHQHHLYIGRSIDGIKSPETGGILERLLRLKGQQSGEHEAHIFQEYREGNIPNLDSLWPVVFWHFFLIDGNGDDRRAQVLQEILQIIEADR